MMQLNIGRTVAHDKFGIGVVKEIDGEKITVDFADAGVRKLLSSFLRAPTGGLLPYLEPEQTVEQALARFAGCGWVPFLVVAAGIDEFAGATVGEFVIDTTGAEMIALPFFLEHPDASTRRNSLQRFSNFSLALGLPAPDDTSDYIGRCGCFRIATAGDFPSFARLAS